jgi:hypothetical protein
MPAFETKERQRANKAAERRSSQATAKKSAKKQALNPPKKDNRLGWKKELDVKATKEKKVAMDKLSKQRRNSEMAAAFLSRKGITHVNDAMAGDMDKDLFNKEMAKRAKTGVGNKIRLAKEEKRKQDEINRRIKVDYEKEQVAIVKNRQKMRRMTIAEGQGEIESDAAYSLGITVEEYQKLKLVSPDFDNPCGKSKMVSTHAHFRALFCVLFDLILTRMPFAYRYAGFEFCVGRAFSDAGPVCRSIRLGYSHDRSVEKEDREGSEKSGEECT